VRGNASENTVRGLCYGELSKLVGVFFISNKDTSFITKGIIKLRGSQFQKIAVFESKATLAKLCATSLP
jgi:hypothetical protein